MSCVTASINLLSQLGKERPCFHRYISEAFIKMVDRFQSIPNSLERNSVLRTIKNGLVLLVKQPMDDGAFFARICDVCEAMGAKSIELPRQRRDINDPEFVPCVTAPSQEELLRERIRVAEAIRMQIDVKSLPLPIIIEMIIQSLQVIPQSEVDYAISRQKQVLSALAASAAPAQNVTFKEEENIKQEVYVPEIAPETASHLPQEEVVPEEVMEDFEHSPTQYDSVDMNNVHIIDVFLRLLQGSLILADDGDAEKKPLRMNRGKIQWIQLVSRMVARVYGSTGLADQLRQCLTDFVCENFKQRYELAQIWLLEEWKLDQDQATAWYLTIIDRVLEDQLIEPRDRAFVRFVVDFPCIPTMLVTRLKNLCNAPNVDPTQPTFVAAVLALKELVDYVPKCRPLAFQAILDLACHSTKQARAPAIISLKQYFPDHPTLSNLVCAHAISSLERLGDPSFTEDSSTTENHEDKVLAQLELSFALCARDPSFFSTVLSEYARLPPSVQPHVRAHVGPLVRAMTSSDTVPPTLVAALENFPLGAESLVLRVLVVLTENAEPSQELVEAIRRMHKEKYLDGRFLLPIISKLDKVPHTGNLPPLYFQTVYWWFPNLCDNSLHRGTYWVNLISLFCFLIIQNKGRRFSKKY
jgi:hypothetical protein